MAAWAWEERIFQGSGVSGLQGVGFRDGVLKKNPCPWTRASSSSQGCFAQVSYTYERQCLRPMAHVSIRLNPNGIQDSWIMAACPCASDIPASYASDLKFPCASARAPLFAHVLPQSQNTSKIHQEQALDLTDAEQINTSEYLGSTQMLPRS